MEDVKSNAGHGLGIAALITAIITFVLAVIPCVGLIAPIPAIIAIILAVVGLSQAARANSPRGLMIAGLIIAVIALMISFSQIFVASKISKNSDSWSEKIQNIVEDVQDNVIRDLEDDNVNIKIESNGDVIEIRANRKDKQKLLEGLEGADTLHSDTSRVE